MKLSDFDYNLPKNLIAKVPSKPRDHSRLLILDKKTGEIEHKKFFNIIDYFNKGDVLVMNNSKVFPARLNGGKKDTGGRVEIFLHKKIDNKEWECIVGGRNIKIGLIVIFSKKLECKIIKNNEDGTWLISFSKAEKEMMKIVEKIGEVPLPPYIKKQRALDKSNIGNDKSNYQTVYADCKKTGSVAAPTAGLHFTKGLLNQLKKKGVIIEYVTLHVGLGTFAPVKIDNVKKHKMHSEWVEVKSGVIRKIKKAKDKGNKVVTVGTTSTRTLEALWSKKGPRPGSGRPIQEWVDIFIYPGYKFKVVDAIITNFHLPKSTLIMLVSALAGKKNIKNAYNIAAKEKYRFYSYGDAMLII